VSTLQLSILKAAAKRLDLSTGPGEAVFYGGSSNRARAIDFARQHGKVLLVDRLQTSGICKTIYRAIFDPEMQSILGLSDSQKDELWSIVSVRYADQASGNVSAFLSGAPIDSHVWSEIQHLERNPRVWSIDPQEGRMSTRARVKVRQELDDIVRGS
jgi:hypothetical protein